MTKWGTRCTVEQAEVYIRQFFDTFPEIESCLALQRQQVALAGRTYTWGGRMRTNSAHRWMVDEPRVRLLLTFHSDDVRWRYWFDVTPVRPAQRFLTCYVHRVWCTHDERGEKSAKLIYDDARGRIGNKWYKHLDEPGYYNLPFRNLAWSSIRQVQKLDRQHRPIEQAKYEGFDRTARQLVNSVMQGGTADLIAGMMINSCGVCEKHGAKLVINIHDELVYSVPDDRVLAFVNELRDVCQRPPLPSWKVPIKMEFKTGKSFGVMEKL